MSERYLRLTCECGRGLRAVPAKAGSTVRCWDCGSEAPVPLPRLRGRLAAEVVDAFREAFGADAVGRGLAAAAVAAGLIALGPFGLAVGLALGLAFAVARRAEIREALATALGSVRRHPAATALVALALPLALVATEAGMVVAAYEQDWLRFLVLDVSPREGAVRVLGGEEEAGAVDLDSITDAEAVRIYAYGLRRGHALVWSVPASLAAGTAPSDDTGYAFANPAAWHEWVDPWAYLGYRALSAVVAMAAVAWVLIAQARAVVRIATFEERYLASLAPPAVAEDQTPHPSPSRPVPALAGPSPFQPWSRPSPLGFPSPALVASSRF